MCNTVHSAVHNFIYNYLIINNTCTRHNHCFLLYVILLLLSLHLTNKT